MITSPALPWTALEWTVDVAASPHPLPHEGVAHASSDMSHFRATEWIRPEMLVDANVTIHGLLHCGGWTRLWSGLPSIPLCSGAASRASLDCTHCCCCSLLAICIIRSTACTLTRAPHRSPPRPGTDKRPARLCPLQRQI